MSTIEIPVMGGVSAGASPEGLASRYRSVRAFTESLTEGLAPEDMVVQSMPDVSPTKWHLAHTSWFFEQFVLTPHLRGYAPLDRTYLYLFNSATSVATSPGRRSPRCAPTAGTWTPPWSGSWARRQPGWRPSWRRSSCWV